MSGATLVGRKNIGGAVWRDQDNIQIRVERVRDIQRHSDLSDGANEVGNIDQRIGADRIIIWNLDVTDIFKMVRSIDASGLVGQGNIKFALIALDRHIDLDRRPANEIRRRADAEKSNIGGKSIGR